jgi:hypothetical protein
MINLLKLNGFLKKRQKGPPQSRFIRGPPTLTLKPGCSKDLKIYVMEGKHLNNRGSPDNEVLFPQFTGWNYARGYSSGETSRQGKRRLGEGRGWGAPEGRQDGVKRNEISNQRPDIRPVGPNEIKQ